MDYYKRYMGDYQRDTGDLSLAQHGAYTVLLDHYYSVRKPLPASMEKLHRLCRATTKLEQEAVETVANEFFPRGDDGLRHNWRADEELAKWDEKASEAASSGKLGAEARWGKQKQKDTRSQRLSAARKLGTHTEAEWRCLIQVCGSQCLRCNTPMDRLEGGAVCKDHIRPLYLGGSDGIENIQPLCRQCNTGKKSDVTDLRPPDWRERLSKCLANAIRTPSENESRTPSKMSGTPMALQNPDPDPNPDPNPESRILSQIESKSAGGHAGGEVETGHGDGREGKGDVTGGDAWRDVTECDVQAYESWLSYRQGEMDPVPARVRLEHAKWLGGRGTSEQQREVVATCIRLQFKRLRDPNIGGRFPNGSGNGTPRQPYVPPKSVEQLEDEAIAQGIAEGKSDTEIALSIDVNLDRVRKVRETHHAEH